ncbi:hypothetical protein V8C34DRAFT_238132 [Trichoderma compactum]
MRIARFGDGGILECRWELRPELAAQIFKKTSKGLDIGFVFLILGARVLSLFIYRAFVTGKTKLFCGCKSVGEWTDEAVQDKTSDGHQIRAMRCMRHEA